ncbi:30S ribosome-binding factor RbfA [Myxococcota bacterium]|nr:30S ribosome-binding factor RbfA [Myxococcota bacterium]
MKPFARTERIGREIQEVLGNLLVIEVRDPRVRGAVVTRVQVTADMSLARVYVRPLQGDDQGRIELMKGLAACKGFLRGEVGRRVRLLRVPALEFHYDEVPDQVARVTDLLSHLPVPAEGGGPDEDA